MNTPMTRIFKSDAVLVQILVTEYDEHGHRIDEQLAQPQRIFRATAPDIWAEVDKAVAAHTRAVNQQARPAKAPRTRKATTP